MTGREARPPCAGESVDIKTAAGLALPFGFDESSGIPEPPEGGTTIQRTGRAEARTTYLDLCFPAVAVGGAGDEFVGGFDVGDFHGGFVPLDGLLGADGKIAKEDEFGEGGGVVEV